MNYILDIVLIGMLLYFIFESARKGFVRDLIEVVGYFASIYAASLISKRLAPICYEKLFQHSITKAVESHLTASASSSSAVQQISSYFSSLPKSVEGMANSIGINFSDIISKLGSAEKETGAKLAESIAKNVIGPVVTNICAIVIFFIALSLLLVLVRFVARAIGSMFNIPVIGGFNRFFGGVLGAVKGIITLFLICAILALLASLLKANSDTSSFLKAIQSSGIVNLVNRHNPILSYLNIKI